ncbi:porin [Limnobacter humi]|uniref:Porin n=1 Tax=Limnobacter humi TaxID=1778671 RepID=A0ABT1WC98_9BURK|nr:porin [Limnobacter humi]MCQ8895137.1 porin [Limnobacter humi]
MNKKLVAAALGLAFAAPVFADASNVTLYGRIHQGLEYNSSKTDGLGTTTSTQPTIVDQSSRLGVRGVEDLGGGLSAIFAYEFGVDTDNVASGAAGAAGPLSTRHAYLGMKGSFGTVVVGSQDGGNDSQAPLYNQASAYIFNVNNNAGQLTVVGSGATNDEVILRNQRVSNAIGYAGNIAGVRISARHVLAGTDQGSGALTAVNPAQNPAAFENGQRQTSVSADYTLGALTFGAGYERRDGTDGYTNAQNALAVTGAVKSQAQIGASYNFGVAQVGGLFAQQKYYGGRDSDNQYAISTLVPLASNYGLQAMYAMSENGKQLNGALSQAAGAQDVDNKQFQVSAYYDFSKRTRSYVGYNRTTRESTSATNALVETKDNSIVLGLRHNF